MNEKNHNAQSAGKAPAHDALIFVKVTTRPQIRAVQRLANRIWNEYYVSLIGKAQVDYMLAHVQSPAAIVGQMRGGYDYFLLRAGRAFIGYLAVRRCARERSLFISKIYVLSSRRGLGYGRRAVAFAEGLAARRRWRRVHLTVCKKNIASQIFYRRCGFVKTGAVTMDIGGGFVMDDFRMEKIL